MTELQMGLIGLGAFAVVGVVAYNKWQEVRQRKLAEQVLNASHPDVLLDEAADPVLSTQKTEMAVDTEEHLALPEQEPSLVKNPIPEGQRIEPVLHLDPEPEELTPVVLEQDAHSELLTPQVQAAEQAAAVVLDQEPLPQQRADFQPVRAAASEQAAPKVEIAQEITQDLHLLSPMIDFIASIDAVEPVPAQRILDAQRDALARVRKPVRWIGYNEEAGEWELISEQEGGEYRYIRAGLQLVNRQGPAGDNELTVFSVAVQDMADQLMGIVELPPRQTALEVAARLDEFCASVDIQIGINVISQGQAFPGTKLRALAEAAGMTIDAGKRFVRRDDEGNVLYLLLNQEASGFSADMMKTMSTHGLTFLLDVPCVAHGERVFNQMVEQARRFADVLHGALVDDNRRPLSEPALEPIRKQIGQYQVLLAAQHLPAGSPLTQRLFS